MSTGDQADFLTRIKAILPPWYGNDETPLLDGALTPPAAVLAQLYALVGLVSGQTRIATETGGYVDLAASDFFGTALPRNSGELDVAYKARIKAALFAKKNTYAALQQAIENLGLTVQIIRPWNPMETSALGVTCFNNVSGYRGSRSAPGQVFAIVTNPANSGVTTAQIWAAINAVTPAGVIIWTAIVA